MPIYNNVLFIHIPKTGGTYIEDRLKKYEKEQNFGYIEKYESYKQHFTYEKYIQFYGRPFVDKLSVFTIIRDPYDRLYSAYKQKYCKYSDPKLIEMFESVDFKDFVLNKLENILNNKNHFSGNIIHILPQSEFISNCPNISIFSYTKLSTIENYLQNYNIFARIEFNNINTTYLSMYDDTMKGIIMRVYQEDLSIYNRYTSP
jgi:hypothetical protein